MVVSAGWLYEGVHVRPCVRVEIVGPGIVRNTNATHIPAEEDHAVGLGIVRHRVAERGGRAQAGGHVRPCVRIEVIGPSVVEQTAGKIPTEQDYPVGLGIVRRRVTVAHRRLREGVFVRPFIRVEVVGPSVVEIVAVETISAEEDHPVGLQIVRHRVPISGRRSYGRVHVCPCVQVEIVGPGVVEHVTIPTPAEEDHPIRFGIVRHRVIDTADRPSRRVCVCPPVRVEVVGPSVTKDRGGILPPEEDHPIGFGIVRHRVVAARRRRCGRVHASPIVHVGVIRPSVVGRAVIPSAEQDHAAGGGVVRHGGGRAAWRTHDRGHVRPRVRLEVVGPRVVGPEPSRLITTPEENHAISLGVVRHRGLRSERRTSGRIHVRPHVRTEVVSPRACSTVASNNQDHPIGLGIVRHPARNVGGRTHGRGHVRPCVRVEVIGPGVVEPVAKKPAKEDHPVGVRVIHHRVEVSSGRCRVHSLGSNRGEGHRGRLPIAWPGGDGLTRRCLQCPDPKRRFVGNANRDLKDQNADQNLSRHWAGFRYTPLRPRDELTRIKVADSGMARVRSIRTQCFGASSLRSDRSRSESRVCSRRIRCAAISFAPIEARTVNPTPIPIGR